MRSGRKRLVSAVVGVAAAAVGVAIAAHFEAGSSGLRPYGLRDTLPEMVARFGGSARVVEIIVDSSGAYFQVIGTDRQLHIRDYTVVESEIEAGTYGYNRKTRNYVRAPTRAESRGAVVTLGQIHPTVVDTLFGKLGFPRQGSSATLTRRSWLLQSGVRPGDPYVAAYDGSGLRRTSSVAPPNPSATTKSGPARAAPPASSGQSTASTTTVYSFSTTISSGPARPRRLESTRRLLTCIEHAQGDPNKIVACQRRFVP